MVWGLNNPRKLKCHKTRKFNLSFVSYIFILTYIFLYTKPKVFDYLAIFPPFTLWHTNATFFLLSHNSLTLSYFELVGWLFGWLYSMAYQLLQVIQILFIYVYTHTHTHTHIYIYIYDMVPLQFVYKDGLGIK